MKSNISIQILWTPTSIWRISRRCRNLPGTVMSLPGEITYPRRFRPSPCVHLPLPFLFLQFFLSFPFLHLFYPLPPFIRSYNPTLSLRPLTSTLPFPYSFFPSAFLFSSPFHPSLSLRPLTSTLPFPSILSFLPFPLSLLFSSPFDSFIQSDPLPASTYLYPSFSFNSFFHSLSFIFPFLFPLHPSLSPASTYLYPSFSFNSFFFPFLHLFYPLPLHPFIQPTLSLRPLTSIFNPSALPASTYLYPSFSFNSFSPFPSSFLFSSPFHSSLSLYPLTSTLPFPYSFFPSLSFVFSVLFPLSSFHTTRPSPCVHLPLPFLFLQFFLSFPFLHLFYPLPPSKKSVHTIHSLPCVHLPCYLARSPSLAITDHGLQDLP
ncbi:hypothetical protein C7M84_020184 [Penaeus vannamei]|uniref:Uncharacterized protein n=1 Tax=Penaeus vannamei TaxID=6689 RepID=A0A3R7LQW0_PENVA|nr:hypothetical protein C7M84_020184 [Penaeus vannamei]